MLLWAGWRVWQEGLTIEVEDMADVNRMENPDDEAFFMTRAEIWDEEHRAEGRVMGQRESMRRQAAMKFDAETAARLGATPCHVRFVSCEPLLADLGHLALRPDRLHWIIVGGESGPGARPMHADWVRSIRDQCLTASIPFFFKQWGGPRPTPGGRHLDGRTWDQMPSL